MGTSFLSQIVCTKIALSERLISTELLLEGIVVSSVLICRSLDLYPTGNAPGIVDPEAIV